MAEPRVIAKMDLVRELTDQHPEWTKKLVLAVVEAYSAELRAHVLKGDILNLTYSGLGRFTPVTRKARRGRNPQTGETLMIPETRSVSFRPAPALRRALNGKEG